MSRRLARDMGISNDVDKTDFPSLTNPKDFPLDSTSVHFVASY